MTLATELKKPSSLIRIGLIALALAGLSRWLLPADLSESTADAVRGILSGIAIVFLLLGIWKSGRRRSKTNRGPIG